MPSLRSPSPPPSPPPPPGFPLPADLSPSNHAYLSCLRVTGGYLPNLTLPFSPGGNVALGEPGSGKSTFLAIIRYVLALPVPSKKLEEFEAVIAANLGSGRAYLTIVNAHGVAYEISRAGGEGFPRVETKDDNAPSIQAILEMIPVRFLGHGELDLFATDTLARLGLLRQYVRDDVSAIERNVVQVRRELNAGAPALWRIEREIKDLEAKHKTLPAERGRLEALKKAAGGDPGELETANRAKALRERERLVLEGADREVGWLRGEASVFAAKALSRLGQVSDAEAEKGPNAPLLADVTRELARLRTEIETFATRAGVQCENLRGVLEASRRALAAVHAPEDDAYRLLLAKHESDAGRAFERLTLEKSVAALEKTRDEHAARVRERDRMLAAREVLLTRQRALLHDLLHVLEAGADRMTEALGKRVIIAVAEFAERRFYRELLGDILKGKRFEKDTLDVVAAKFNPEDLLAQVLKGDTQLLAEELGSAATAGRLVEKLLETDRIYELETVDIPHVPNVSFVHGETPKGSPTLSSGQIKQAFLSMLLLVRNSTLVIDQPEDDVANKYLAGALCAMFAEVQEDMQFIFVTHDGNIPILGRVRRVVHFASDGNHAWVAAGGEPEQVRAPMEDNFEGGRTAFVARKDFYGA